MDRAWASGINKAFGKVKGIGGKAVDKTKDAAKKTRDAVKHAGDKIKEKGD